MRPPDDSAAPGTSQEKAAATALAVQDGDKNPAAGQVFPTISRIVHFVLPSGKHRPAIVVEDWGGKSMNPNLQVFVDGTNDTGIDSNHVIWRTSVPYDELGRINTWHWPERH